MSRRVPLCLLALALALALAAPVAAPAQDHGPAALRREYVVLGDRLTTQVETGLPGRGGAEAFGGHQPGSTYRWAAPARGRGGAG